MSPEPYKQNSRSGAALIIVLGILTVMTLLIVAFSISTQMTRLTARNYRQQSSTEHYIRAGIPLAMATIDQTMTNATLPMAAWQSPILYIATNEEDTAQATVIIGAVTNSVPIGWREYFTDTPEDFNSSWMYVINKNPQGETIATNGRIAFIAGDLSGFVDINNAPDILLAELLGIEVDKSNPFFSLADLTSGDEAWINLTSNLVCDSYDVGPDCYLSTNNYPIGRHDMRPAVRFPVNSITNYTVNSSTATVDSYHLIEIVEGYLNPMREKLQDAGFNSGNAEMFLWNLVNYIDDDSLPQDGTLTPWLSPGLNETVPIINEITLLSLPPVPASESNHYEFAIELWYPYPPEEFTAADYTLHLNIRRDVANISSGTVMLNEASSLALDLVQMDYTPALGGFQVLYTGKTEPVKFPITVQTESGTRDVFLPIGNATLKEFGPLGWVTTEVLSSAAISVTLSNTTYNATVDMAMNSGDLWSFTNLYGYAAANPLDNAVADSWRGPLADTEQSLGTTNGFSWVGSGYDVPIFIRNAPLETIGEMGLICTSSLESVDCMSLPGAALFDTLTVRSASNRVVRGLVGIGAAEPVWAALFSTVSTGATNSPTNMIDADEAAKIAEALTAAIAGYGEPVSIPSWASVLPLMSQSTNWLSDLPPEQREAPLRHIVENVSFRQNIFILWLLAQATTDDGRTALAERRATAVVLRDAYTGKWMLRNLQWIED